MSKRWTHQPQWRRTIPQLLREACERHPRKIFVDFSGEAYSYHDLERATRSVASGMLAHGVRRGDRVCGMLGNCSDQIVFWFAANRIGAIYVPLNTDLRGEFLRHPIADSGAALAIVESQYLERIQEIEAGVPELLAVACRGQPRMALQRIQLMGVDELRAPPRETLGDEPQPGDLALLLYTSGTTGPSKGCMLSHACCTRFGSRMGDATLTTQADVLWTPCPLFHAAALIAVVINALVAGASAAIAPRFSASRFWEDVHRSRATAVCIVSTMLPIIANAPDSEAARRCRGQLRLVWGAPLNRALIQKWKRRFAVKHVSPVGFSMTEAPTMLFNCVTSRSLPDGATGRRHGDFDARILDEQGEECAPGVVGELVVRPNYPDIMFQGYWRRPEATLAVLSDCWFHTGDLGKFDEKGYFYFSDRKKDCLRVGGENVSSVEVEAAFLAHPDIAEAAVHSVKSDLAEDELKLTAVLRPEARTTPQEIMEWCLDRLPRFAVPRYIEFRSVLPRTPTNRVQKFVLRSDGVTPTTWDRRRAGVELRRRQG